MADNFANRKIRNEAVRACKRAWNRRRRADPSYREREHRRAYKSQRVDRLLRSWGIALPCADPRRKILRAATAEFLERTAGRTA